MKNSKTVHRPSSAGQPEASKRFEQTEFQSNNQRTVQTDSEWNAEMSIAGYGMCFDH